MTDGAPEIDPHGSDIARFYAAPADAAPHRRARVRGLQQDLRDRPPDRSSGRPTATSALSPFHAREQELGAVFFETAGWERPCWYESNAALLEEYGDRVMPREAEWESRWWSPIINAEHLAMRDRVGDGRPVGVRASSTSPARARSTTSSGSRSPRSTSPVGRVVYTPLLNDGRRDQGRPDDHAARPRPLPGRHRRRARDARPEVVRRPPAGGRLGAAHDVTVGLVHGRRLGAARARPRRLGDERRRLARGLPVRRCREVEIGGVRALASRISYVGELGWEIYAPMEQGAALWDALWEAGQPHGVVPVGIGVYGTTGRLEKGYRAHGAELELGVRPRRGRHGPPEGQGRRLRRQGRVPRAARRGAGGDPVHADGRRPDVVVAASSATCSGASRS